MRLFLSSFLGNGICIIVSGIGFEGMKIRKDVHTLNYFAFVGFEILLGFA